MPNPVPAEDPNASAPLGVILAGGRGSRLGGAKASVLLRGRPLIEYPLSAVSAVLPEVVILAKPDTELPELPGATVWREPGEPHHPLFGIVHALERAGGRQVLACAADLPFVSAALIEQLRAPVANRAARIAGRKGRLQPLLGLYLPEATAALRTMLEVDPQIAATAAVTGLYPELLDVEDTEALFNVNTPVDLRYAERILERRD